MLKKIKSSLKNTTLYKLVGLYKHFQNGKNTDSSFAGEYIYLKKIVESLKIDSGFVVDIAASDGVSQSCTLEFFRNNMWSGLAVEMDPTKFYKLSFVYEQFTNTRLFRYKVTPNNVTSILRAAEVPLDFTLLNLDIDSYDYFVIQNILKADFKPLVITMEINEKFPPPIHFAVNFDENHVWSGDHFYGCSLEAAANLIKPYGYILESLQFNNAIFVRADYSTNKFDDMETKVAYDLGYKNNPERKKLFPWNKDVDCVLNFNHNDGLAYFENYFLKYKDKFTMF